MRFAGIAVVFLCLFCLSVVAQDRLAIEQADKERDVYKNLVVGKKFTRRLPNGYGPVVSNSQREEIYKTQQDYFETIELLKVRIEMLEAERNLKIDGLLTGEQRARIKTILSSLESERSARQASRQPARTAVRRAPAGGAAAPAANGE